MLRTFLNPKSLHHAYLLEGDKELAVSELKVFCEDALDCPTTGNPDFAHFSFQAMGIDEGRMIKELQSRKSFREGGKQVFIITTDTITHEAQNSLLKVFEEPTSDTHFFLVMPQTEHIIPTLKSRLAFIRMPEGKEEEMVGIVKDFLKGSFKERAKLLSDIVEEKNKERAIAFLNTLEKTLYEKRDVWGSAEDQVFLFTELRQCRSYLHDRAPSVKMILEHVALIVPCVEI